MTGGRGKLYDENGRVIFLSVREVSEALLLYEAFIHRKNAFKEEPEAHASSLIGDLRRLKCIPKEVRHSLSEHSKIRDSDLDALEKECREYVSKGVLKVLGYDR